jgi:hypothetical protein
VVSTFGARVGPSEPGAEPLEAAENKWCAGIAGGVYTVGLVGAKTEIPARMWLRSTGESA